MSCSQDYSSQVLPTSTLSLRHTPALSPTDTRAPAYIPTFTATLIGDPAEVVAVKSVFGPRAHEIPYNASKSMIGHPMGASGAVEAIATIMTIQDGILHPTINYENPDLQCDLDCVPNEARKAQVDIALNNSFGFGGQNACLVLGRYE